MLHQLSIEANKTKTICAVKLCTNVSNALLTYATKAGSLFSLI